MNNVDFKNYFKNYPSKEGYFGKYGGNYTPAELKEPLEEVTRAYFSICHTPEFINELKEIRNISKVALHQFIIVKDYRIYLVISKST